MFSFRKKRLSFVLAVMLIIASIGLTSCGSSVAEDGFYDYAGGLTDSKQSSTAAPGAGFNSSNGAYYDDVVMEEAVDFEAEYPQAESQAEDKIVAEAEQTSRKIIYSGWANVQTKEYEKSIDLLTQLCDKYGAYFESSSSYGNRLDYQTERSSEYRIRIPVKNYLCFKNEVGSIGSVVQSGEDNKDVTEQYIDIEARLESAQIREERVIVLLENAANLDDVLALERELSDIRYEIESMTGSLRKLDSLVSFATFNLTIEEVVEYRAPITVPKTFSERLSQNFKDGWRDFVVFWQNVVIALSYNVFTIIVWAIIIVFAVIVISALRKRNSKIKEKKRLAYIERANMLNKESEAVSQLTENSDKE